MGRPLCRLSLGVCGLAKSAKVTRKAHKATVKSDFTCVYNAQTLAFKTGHVVDDHEALVQFLKSAKAPVDIEEYDQVVEGIQEADDPDNA